MALDNRGKRASAMGLALPFLIVGTLPEPDGSIDMIDRPQTIQMANWPPSAPPAGGGGSGYTTMHPIIMPRRRR